MEEIQDDACFRGTFKSILSECSLEARNFILEKIEEKTVGDSTYIEPQEVENLVSKCFKVDKNISINKLDDLSAEANKVDNKTSFGILFLKGNASGGNRHATRFISQNPNEIQVMDPQIGKCVTRSFDQWNQLSPEGFD